MHEDFSWRQTAPPACHILVFVEPPLLLLLLLLSLLLLLLQNFYSTQIQASFWSVTAYSLWKVADHFSANLYIQMPLHDPPPADADGSSYSSTDPVVEILEFQYHALILHVKDCYHTILVILNILTLLLSVT